MLLLILLGRFLEVLQVVVLGLEVVTGRLVDGVDRQSQGDGLTGQQFLREAVTVHPCEKADQNEDEEERASQELFAESKLLFIIHNWRKFSILSRIVFVISHDSPGVEC